MFRGLGPSGCRDVFAVRAAWTQKKPCASEFSNYVGLRKKVDGKSPIELE